MLKEKGSLYRIALLIEGVALLVLLLSCFGSEELADSFSGEEIGGLLMQAEDHTEFQSEPMALTPGVYQVRIRSHIEEGQQVYVVMESVDACYNTLRNNGMWVLGMEEPDCFEVYVTGEIPSAYVLCSFYGAEPESILQLEVWKTKAGNRMLLFGAFICFSVLDFFVLFRRRILEGRVTPKQQVVFWVLAGCVLLDFFPYLTDYLILGEDTALYLKRIASLADAFQGVLSPAQASAAEGGLAGQLYLLLLSDGGIFLVLPALLKLAGFSILSAYRIFFLLVAGVTAVIAYHSFYRCVKEEYAALAGSAVYLLIPYRLFDMYNRGAMGECLAMAFLPLVCCGMYLLYTENGAAEECVYEYKKGKWYLAWGMSAVLQSHLVTMEMTVVLMAAVCLIFWKKTLRKQNALQLLEALGIVLVLNMWFWFPKLSLLSADTRYLAEVLGETGQGRGALLAGFFQMLPEKGSAQAGMWQSEPLQLGAGVMMLLLLQVLLGWKRGKEEERGRDSHEGRMCRLLAIFTVVLLVMSTRYLPWEHLPWEEVKRVPWVGGMVAFLRFPSCWMALASVLAALFTAFFILQVEKKSGRLVRRAAVVSMAVVFGAAVYQVNSIALHSSPTWLYNIENIGSNGVVNAEYLTVGADRLISVLWPAVGGSVTGLVCLLALYGSRHWKWNRRSAH